MLAKSITATPIEMEAAYHQSRQSAGLNPSVDLVQDPSLLAFDVDVVTYILPVKDVPMCKSDVLSGSRSLLATWRDLLGVQGLLVITLQLSFWLRCATATENEDLALGFVCGDKLG